MDPLLARRGFPTTAVTAPSVVRNRLELGEGHLTVTVGVRFGEAMLHPRLLHELHEGLELGRRERAVAVRIRLGEERRAFLSELLPERTPAAGKSRRCGESECAGEHPVPK